MHIPEAFICIIGVLAVAGAEPLFGADETQVYVDNPRREFYIARSEELRRLLPLAKARWDDRATKGVSYVISFTFQGEGKPARCNGVPISVHVKDGRIVSQAFAVDTPRCKRGSRVKSSDDEAAVSLMSPESLFQEVASGIEKKAGAPQPCFDSEFDKATGLPKFLQYGCPWMMDSGYRIQLSNIVTTK